MTLFSLEDDEDFIDVGSLEWEEHEQVTQARSPASESPFHTCREEGIRSVESVPSLASLRARAASSPPPPDSDANLTRPIQPPWLSARDYDPRRAAPPRPHAPGPPARTDDFDARVTARRPRVTPLPPSRSAVIQVAAQEAQHANPSGPPREGPDASLALPLLRPSVEVEVEVEAETEVEAVVEVEVEAAAVVEVEPLRSETPRAAVPPSRWMQEIGVEQRELRREIAELRSLVRVATLLATLAGLACLLLAGVLAATS